jgi:NADPH:quinone reductase-like Zn-dependent oxidoreductase
MTTSSDTLTEIVLPGLVDPDGLLVEHRPVAAPARGEALVQMLAAGVSFGEQSMRRGLYPGQPRFPFVMGYDIVGTVTAVGADVDPALLGRRVAAVTKTGGWTTHALLDARTLVPVPGDIDPADVETVLLNGITATQMLFRKAHGKSGQTILVHGANGGVAGVLVQLARHSGIRVIGTAAPRHHDALRELGVEPVDYHDPDIAGIVRTLVPGGVDAVFDHLGEPSFAHSFNLLAPGGTLVAYGLQAQLGEPGSMILTFVKMYSRLVAWTLRPNHGRTAVFYNFWGGKHSRPGTFRRHLAQDLTSVVTQLRDGVLTARVGARIPLAEAGRALALAESGTVSGKIVLVP